MVSVFKADSIRRNREKNYYNHIREEKEKDTVLMLSSVHFRKDLWQRPQQLAVEMARKGKKVVFLNNRSVPLNVGWNLGENGLPASIFTKTLLQGKEDNGVIVVDRIDYINDQFGNSLWVRDQYIKEFIRFYKGGDTTVLTYLPEFSEDLEPLAHNIRIYYECVDERTGDQDTKKIILKEKKLLDIADGVIVTSNTLYVHKTKSGKPCALIPNGVNYEDFLLPCEKPEQLKDMGGPIIGYAGAIAKWFDQELMVKVARMNPEKQFVLVGKIFTDISMLELEPNIHFLGTIEYTKVPTFMQHFDVGIIPFKIDDLIINTNPIKYFEYLSSGIPTVSTPLPELIKEPNCELAETAEEFSYLIEKVLKNKGFKRDLDYLKDKTWSKRAHEILGFINPKTQLSNSRERTLKNILDKYEGYKGGMPLLEILKIEIYQELGMVENAKELFMNHEKKFKDICLPIQLKLCLQWEDYERIANLLITEMGNDHDVKFWRDKGTDFLKMIAYRKIGEFEKALNLANVLLEKETAVNEEIGNINFEIGNYTLAARHYVTSFAKKQMMKTKEGTENFSIIASNMGRMKLSEHLKSLFR
ncbi:glycosyltransferase [Neobacillus pocheonensis]|uniref:Glycosyltransferase n=1 Tax=Neobacillus pocheonensis TaxID=363869 RepID=A0ABT0W6K3_9BACI|nr:glycosyltransferase [Neobacillus pocheonensis]